VFLLNEVEFRAECIGQLAVIENNNTSKIYIVWDVNEKKEEATLVELDISEDENMLKFDLKKEDIFILEPHELLERVTAIK
jgi:hypothetical protein